MNRLDDDQLLALTASRPEAFAVFYRRHERTMLGFFARRASDPELAADLTAETFAAALVGARRFEPSLGPVLAWTFGIANNQLRRAWAKRRVEDRARRRLAMPPLVIEDELLDRIERLGRGSRGGRPPPTPRAASSSASRPGGREPPSA